MVLALDSDIKNWFSIPFTPTNVLAEDLSEYPNPFQNHPQSSVVAGIVVTGHSGIGEPYVSRRPRAMNLPTLFLEERRVYVWQNGQLYSGLLDYCSTRDFRVILDKTAWCLVDSTSQVKDVPCSLYQAGRFIIQAADSPIRERVRWEDKASMMVNYLFMRDWSAAELIAARQLQYRSFRLATPENLVEFCEKFGGSARQAYREAHNVEKEPEGMAMLERAARNFGVEFLTQSCFIPFRLSEWEDNYRFVSVFPRSDEDRTRYTIRPPTEKVMDVIVQAISNKLRASRVDIFNQLSSSRVSWDWTLAGPFYRQYFHEFLCRDVKLKCFRFLMNPPSEEPHTGQKTQFWSADDSKAYLFSMKKSPILRFNPDDLPKLEVGRYYIPRSRAFSIFDAIWIGTQTHAVIFQAVTEHPHGLSFRGLDWLAAQGLETIEYAYVTPSSAIQKVNVPFPVAIPGSFRYDDLANYPKTAIIGDDLPVQSGEKKSSINDSFQLWQDLPVKTVGIYHLILDFADYVDTDILTSDSEKQKAPPKKKQKRKAATSSQV
ncbi:hypothetical protein GYMLUDRAFT_260992 [Collybiopsis luxurians FD-317 M1]|uniref:Uncharacterized protein n=1 Tax=Collybiopsis luxurians FD-317 M1 TaxID=944289 RepID=A0A0D0BBC3_9AGAR|nr:hypothetical protein GYMLUDRAFT_260992 [Collybiopsis luxurians FD-317 M1]